MPILGKAPSVQRETMKLQDISMKWKMLLLALAGPVIVASILAWQRVGDIRDGAEQSLIEKSKQITIRPHPSP